MQFNALGNVIVPLFFFYFYDFIFKDFLSMAPQGNLSIFHNQVQYASLVFLRLTIMNFIAACVILNFKKFIRCQPLVLVY